MGVHQTFGARLSCVVLYKEGRMAASLTSKYDVRFAGIWKFRVHPDKLEEVAQRWISEIEGTFEYLQVRDSGHGVFVIEFRLILPRRGMSEKDVIDRYKDETSDALKREFGNGLIGWDISNFLKAFA